MSTPPLATGLPLSLLTPFAVAFTTPIWWIRQFGAASGDQGHSERAPELERAGPARAAMRESVLERRLDGRWCRWPDRAPGSRGGVP